MYIDKEIKKFTHIKCIPNIVITFGKKHLFIDIYFFKYVTYIKICFLK